MQRIKDIFFSNKQILWGAIIHSCLLLGALVFAYNSHKEYMRHHVFPIPMELRLLIKATFPWAIMIFIILFVLYGIWRRERENYPTLRQYIVIFGLQAIIVNLVFFFKGPHILIVQNLALFYFAVLLAIWGVIGRLIIIDKTGWVQELLPPIVYRPLQRNIPWIREYVRKKPVALFVAGFMALLMICAFLLIFKEKKIAEQIADIAYVLLIIGIGIEIYQLIKYGNTDEQKED